MIENKGGNVMRIAVSYEEGNVFEHVGDTETFKVYDVEGEKVVKTELLRSKGTGRDMVIDFATEHKVEVLICGRICSGAKDALSECGVKTFGCVSGSADEAVEAYIKGTLEDSGTSVCEHND